jgi:hypothetical protein
MQVSINEEEWYPVFVCTDFDLLSDATDVHPTTFERWRKVFLEFESVQSEMRATRDAIQMRKDKESKTVV